MNRKLRKFAEREAATRGLSLTWTWGSKHGRLRICRGDDCRTVTVGSNANEDQFDWLRQDLKRIDRELR